MKEGARKKTVNNDRLILCSSLLYFSISPQMIPSRKTASVIYGKAYTRSANSTNVIIGPALLATGRQ